MTQSVKRFATGHRTRGSKRLAHNQNPDPRTNLPKALGLGRAIIYRGFAVRTCQAGMTGTATGASVRMNKFSHIISDFD